MGIFDAFLLLILFGFVWFGFWFGFIHTLGALVGTIAGAFIAGRLYLPIFDLVVNWIGYDSGWIKIIIFLILFIVINRLVGFGFYILDRTFRFVSFIPFLKTINHLGGAVLGLVEGGLTLGLVLYFSGSVDLPLSITQAIANSDIAQDLIMFAGVLIPLLPEVLEKIQPYIPNVNLSI
ncbi:MAG: CvpA family protein [Patescibacteria group bacterium]